MLLSHSYKFLFIHIPKTAGSSITTALAPYSEHPERHWYNRWLSCVGINVNWYGPLRVRNPRKHTTFGQAKRIYPKAMLDSYFKFAFVRNPWDLMVSYYHYIKSRENHHRSRQVNALKSFKDYIYYEIDRGKVSQSRLIYDANDNLQMNYVGRFENLEENFQEICLRVGLPHVRLEHQNKSARRSYQEYYDLETRDLVAKHWEKDIDLFKYSFDDSKRTRIA